MMQEVESTTGFYFCASRYTGKERDAESNLDNFGARYYSSSMGTFMSVDPSGRSVNLGDPQTWNRYVYVRDNPIGFVDPNGKWLTPTHEAIYAHALYFLSAGDLDVINAASAEVDEDQSVEGSRKHGMSMPDQDHVSAMIHSEKWIEDNIDSAVNAQLTWEAAGESPENQEARSTLNSPDALRFFGFAAHDVSDQTSPPHRGFQTWNGVGVPDTDSRYQALHIAQAAIHGFRDAWDGLFDPADQALAAQKVHDLWIEYQARFEAARKKKLMKAKPANGCPTTKAKGAGDPCTPESTK